MTLAIHEEPDEKKRRYRLMTDGIRAGSIITTPTHVMLTSLSGGTVSYPRSDMRQICEFLIRSLDQEAT